MSLFPAYSAESPPTTSGSDNQAISSWLQNVSFASFKPPTAENLSEITIAPTKPTEAEDDDGDVEVIGEVARKIKKKDKKESKKSKAAKALAKAAASKAVAVERPKAQRKIPWSFASSADEVTVICDRWRDLENLQFNSIYQRHVPNYNYTCRSCLGGNATADRLMFPPSDKKTKRYFKRRARHLPAFLYDGPRADDEVRAPLVDAARRRPVDLADFVELVEAEIVVHGERHVFDADTQMYRAVDADADEQTKTRMLRPRSSATEMGRLAASELERRRLALSRAVQDAPHNVEQWLEFVRLQDDLFAETAAQPARLRAVGAAPASDRALLERKMAILERALQHNPACLRLKVARLDVGKDLWPDRAALAKAWQQVQFTHVNDLEMWSAYLDFSEQHFAEFTVQKQLKLFERCLERLQAVLSGTLLTHPAHLGTAEYLMSVVFRMCRFLAGAGYWEKAVGGAQAIVEFNFFAPPELVSLPLAERRSHFEPFWDSGVPRFGEEGALGWAETVRLAKEHGFGNSSAAATDDADAAEDALVSSAIADRRTDGFIWAAVEERRGDHQWLPLRRAHDELDDGERLVMFDDICHCLVDVTAPPLRFRVLCELLRLLGASLPETDASDASAQPTRIESALRSFDALPEVGSVWHGMHGRSEYVERVLSSCLALPEMQGELFQSYFSAAQLDSFGSRFAFDKSLSTTERGNRFRRSAKEFIRKEHNRNRLPLYVGFSAWLDKFGVAEEAANVARTILANCQNVWLMEDDCLQQVSCLQLFLFYAKQIVRRYCTFADDSVKSLLCQLFNEGRLVDANCSAPSASAVIKAKRLAFERWDALTLRYGQAFAEDLASQLTVRWLGSAYNLTTQLFMYLTIVCDFASLDEADERFAAALTTVRGSGSPSAVVDTEVQRLHLHRVQLLQLYRSGSLYCPPQLVRDGLRDALAACPHHAHLLQCFVDEHISGHSMVALRRYLADAATTRRRPLASPTRCLAALYAEFRRYVALLEANADGSRRALPETQRLRRALECGAALWPRALVFWQLAARFEALRADRNALEGVYFRALGQCAAAKQLYVEMVRALPAKLQMVTDLMTEKGIRLRLLPEEVDILKEAAAKQSEEQSDDSDSDQ